MSKLKESPWQKAEKQFERVVRSKMEYEGRKADVVARMMGVNETTVRKHIKSPGMIRVTELRMLKQILKLSNEDIINLIG